MPIPADHDAEINRYLRDAFGHYFETVSDDGTKFYAFLTDFDVGSPELKFLHIVDLNSRIVPLGTEHGCLMDVYGFASNTTNANWSHAQNLNLALDRLAHTAQALIDNGVPVELIKVQDSMAAEVGDEGDENPELRFTMVVVHLNGVPAPTPLATP